MPVERVNIETAGSPWKEEHLSRYCYASKFLSGKKVLDIACGTGFGSELLIKCGAKAVYAADISQEALQEASERLRLYGNKAVAQFEDGTKLSFQDDFFDAVVSFETIEHIKEAETFIQELHRVLKPEGALFISTPNALVTKPINGIPTNPFHVREYTPEEFKEIFLPYFTIELESGQHLPDKYGVAPFLPSFPYIKLNLKKKFIYLYWRIMLRLPIIRNFFHNLLFGFDFFPKPEDYTFLNENLNTAHVQYYILKKK
jgi:ubiquinone/menaquinone biosynthesis C-methylase UbiE